MMKTMSRTRRVIAAFAIATALISVGGVASADAYPGAQNCVIANHRVHHGDHDPARCIHLMKNHQGVAYVVQKEVHRVGRKGHKHRKVVYVVYTLAHFRSNRFGNARIRLTIPDELRYGVHHVHFKSGRKYSEDWIAVVRG